MLQVPMQSWRRVQQQGGGGIVSLFPLVTGASSHNTYVTLCRPRTIKIVSKLQWQRDPLPSIG